jgi:hypothetical protein
VVLRDGATHLPHGGTSLPHGGTRFIGLAIHGSIRQTRLVHLDDERWSGQLMAAVVGIVVGAFGIAQSVAEGLESVHRIGNLVALVGAPAVLSIS